MEASVTIKVSPTELNVLRHALTSYERECKEVAKTAGGSDRQSFAASALQAKALGETLGA